MSKDETMQEIAETLASINDSLEGINAELEEICMSSKMLIFFKMIELRPEMKEKLGPLIDDLAESMDLGMNEEPEKE
ncbi:MAG: hypothetical protein PHS80_07970 [Methanothrix sp.]|nr:hypothetical protein [Methanothrix sp.]MDD4447328.1 hypothetical protein [Methanothrix sp.]